MPFIDLGDDILLHILLFLTVTDISSLRQTCRYLCLLTSTRYLWNYLLERDVVAAGAPLPWYRKPTTELSAAGIESLVRRALILNEWPHQMLITRFDQPGRAVTWVRLIHGQWVLMALGDLLELHSISNIQAGSYEPAATMRLPGLAHSGEVDVEEDQIVIALSVRYPNEHKAVMVLSLRQLDGSLEFHELGRFNNFSHVKALRGTLVGCGNVGDAKQPFVLNWRTDKGVPLPSAWNDKDCLAMSMRQDYCVVVTAGGAQVHTFSKESGVELAETFQFDDVVSGASISKEHETLPSFVSGDGSDSLLIVTTSSTTTALYQLQRTGSASFTMSKVAADQFKAGDPRKTRPAQPCFGGSMSRISWVNSSANFMACRPSLATARIQEFAMQDTTNTDAYTAKLDVSPDINHHRVPSHLTLPVRDYDDGAGLLVMGNSTGQLALLSEAGKLSPGLLNCFKEVPFSTRAS